MKVPKWELLKSTIVAGLGALGNPSTAIAGADETTTKHSSGSLLSNPAALLSRREKRGVEGHRCFMISRDPEF